jgi:FkbM family methyltransferase
MNVFIDLGSHFGAIIRKFMASKLFSSDFIIHAFEPNPAITSDTFDLYPPKVVVHREAAWICDGEINLYINQNPRVQGSSIFRQKTTGNLDKDHPARVKCIDFGAWLRKNFSKSDNIIVKSNIEGAEYELFDRLVADGTIEFIKKLYLRRHWQKIGMSIDQDIDFVERLVTVPGLVLFNNYSF